VRLILTLLASEVERVPAEEASAVALGSGERVRGATKLVRVKVRLGEQHTVRLLSVRARWIAHESHLVISVRLREADELLGGPLGAGP
tara:strand:+ start:774 stop:1037 length:264 start_codon:yes stop_codon:yes gene_type:complete